MGDRANVVIREPGGPDVYLYTHWGGSDLPEALRSALVNMTEEDAETVRERWTFSDYIQRRRGWPA